MKPKGSFVRSRSAGREELADERHRSSLSFASISAAIPTAIPTAKDFAGVRIGLEKEKKEAECMRNLWRIPFNDISVD